MKKYLRSYWFLFLLAGLIVLLDQVSKSYIRANFVENVDVWAPADWMLPYARIVHITNTGVAFGMFQGLISFLPPGRSSLWQLSIIILG